jgi:hypothetical protein
MKLRFLTVWSAFALLVTTTACEKASPTRPTDVDSASATAASVTDARSGATIIAAKPVSPAAGAQIPWAQQPITLTITNGTTTGSSALAYTFEVASDAAFTRRAFLQENVAGGASGTTSVTVGRLAGSTTYYWRSQANLSGGGGPYSAVRTFAVGPEVVLGTPTLGSPINGDTTFSPLSLVINNISRSGPAGPITYRVDVASDGGFGNVLFTTNASEQSGAQTTVTAPVSGLTNGSTYYWRARATDSTNGITTSFSTTASFVIQSFNFATAKHWDNPDDTGTWPVGAKITYLEFTGFSMRVDFDRRDGANRWPDVYPSGGSPPGLQYTLGMCLNIQGQWNCSAVVQFWHGRNLDDTAAPSEFWLQWWYEPGRWGPMTYYHPAEGETVGVYVAAGDLRFRGSLFGFTGYTRATCPRVCEVSNVALVPFTYGYSKYEY